MKEFKYSKNVERFSWDNSPTAHFSFLNDANYSFSFFNIK